MEGNRVRENGVRLRGPVLERWSREEEREKRDQEHRETREKGKRGWGREGVRGDGVGREEVRGDGVGRRRGAGRERRVRH